MGPCEFHTKSKKNFGGKKKFPTATAASNAIAEIKRQGSSGTIRMRKTTADSEPSKPQSV